MTHERRSMAATSTSMHTCESMNIAIGHVDTIQRQRRALLPPARTGGGVAESGARWRTGVCPWQKVSHGGGAGFGRSGSAGGWGLLPVPAHGGGRREACWGGDGEPRQEVGDGELAWSGGRAREKAGVSGRPHDARRRWLVEEEGRGMRKWIRLSPFFF